MAAAFSVLVTIIIAGFLWFYVVRPILEDFELIGPRGVNDYQEAAPLMSREIVQTKQTDQTDQTDQGSSEADLWMDRIAIDKTKTTLIELLVYSDWDVREIRSVIKGDNTVLGAEIEQARKQLGIAPQLTPIAGRQTEASYPNN